MKKFSTYSSNETQGRNTEYLQKVESIQSSGTVIKKSRIITTPRTGEQQQVQPFELLRNPSQVSQQSFSSTNSNTQASSTSASNPQVKWEESVPVNISRENEPPKEENKFKRPQLSPSKKTEEKLVVNPNDLFHNDLSVID